MGFSFLIWFVGVILASWFGILWKTGEPCRHWSTAIFLLWHMQNIWNKLTKPAARSRGLAQAIGQKRAELTSRRSEGCKTNSAAATVWPMPKSRKRPGCRKLILTRYFICPKQSPSLFLTGIIDMNFLNRKQSKISCKAIAETARAHKFTIISNEYLDDLEWRIARMVREDIKQLPSKGKTVYPLIR